MLTYMANVLMEKTPASALTLDWLMTRAVTVLAPPSVKRIIFRLRRAYQLYTKETAHRHHSFISWFAVYQAESFTTALTSADALEWKEFLTDSYHLCGQLSLHRPTSNPNRSLTTSTSSSSADGTSNSDVVDAKGSGTFHDRVAKTSCATQTGMPNSSRVSCSIFCRANDGSCYRRPAKRSGSTYVSIQVGDVETLESQQTNEWGRFMDLNATMALDLEDDSNPIIPPIRHLLDQLERLAQNQL